MRPAARRAMATWAVLAAAGAGGCSDGNSPTGGTRDAAPASSSEGRLRPLAHVDEARGDLAGPGLHELRLGRQGRALLDVPRAVGARRVPLVLALHGAGGSAESGLRVLGGEARAAGVAVLAPASQGRTWDVVLGGFGPDAKAIDTLLQRVSRSLPVDTDRTAIAGFSDGASYALSLGLANGDRFARVIAFSPGFAAPGRRRARPPIFIAHGRDDRVLPIDRTSRRLVPALRDAGHTVVYREFDGGHTVPRSLVREALTELVAPG